MEITNRDLLRAACLLAVKIDTFDSDLIGSCKRLNRIMQEYVKEILERMNIPDRALLQKLTDLTIELSKDSDSNEEYINIFNQILEQMQKPELSDSLTATI